MWAHLQSLRKVRVRLHPFQGCGMCHCLFVHISLFIPSLLNAYTPHPASALAGAGLDTLVLKEAAKSGIMIPKNSKDFRCNQHQFQTLMSRVMTEGFEAEAVATLDEPAQKTQVMAVLDEFRQKGDVLDYKINRIGGWLPCALVCWHTHCLFRDDSCEVSRIVAVFC